MVIYIRGKAAVTLQFRSDQLTHTANDIIYVRDNGTVEVIKSQSEYIRSVSNFFSLQDFLNVLDDCVGARPDGFQTVSSSAIGVSILKAGW